MVGYPEISVKIFFNLTLVPPVKILIFMFLLPRLIVHASQPDGNTTSFTLHFHVLVALVNCTCLTTRWKYDVIYLTFLTLDVIL